MPQTGHISFKEPFFPQNYTDMKNGKIIINNTGNINSFQQDKK